MSKKIPEILYRTKTITLGNNEKVEIKGHRGNDFSQLKGISRIENKTVKLQIEIAKLSMATNEDGAKVEKKDADFSDKDVDQLMKIKEKIDDLQEEVRPLIYKLAQRGLKRFYHPDKKSSELDKLDDYELNYGEILEIHRAMNELDKPLVGDESEEKKEKN